MINNIHILTQPDSATNPVVLVEVEARAAQKQLIKAHRRGAHPYGEKRRACPLCQVGG